MLAEPLVDESHVEGAILICKKYKGLEIASGIVVPRLQERAVVKVAQIGAIDLELQSSSPHDVLGKW
jgi:hypothetical protein